MKTSKAKEKICPFMSNFIATSDQVGEFHTTCICGDCMAWVYTKENKTKEESINSLSVDDKNFYQELIKNISSTVFIDRSYIKNYRLSNIVEKINDLELPEDEKEGYCIRLKGEQ